jgi:hypothetical protein
MRASGPREMSEGGKIYVVSAGRMSMGPAEEAFRTVWPEARTVHLLDESIFSDAARIGASSPEMLRRFELLGEYCAVANARAVLFTCSAFAEAIGRIRRVRPFPVLTPNEALLERLLETPGRTALLVTFRPSVDALRDELEGIAAARGVAPRVDFHFVPDAFEEPDHDRRVVDACLRLDADYTALAFGQFSMVSAAPQARARCSVPIWDTPSTAVEKLKRRCEAQ